MKIRVTAGDDPVLYLLPEGVLQWVDMDADPSGNTKVDLLDVASLTP